MRKFMILLSALTLLAVHEPQGALALSHKEERDLGRKVLHMIKKNMTLLDDPAVNDYVNDLGRKILNAIGSQPFDYHFYVIDDDTINAFATPGGHVFVHSGLISHMECEAQLAAILCHEISHVTGRHISKRMSQTKGLTMLTLAGMVAGAMIGGPVGSAIVMGSMAGTVQAQLAYSREDEREADGVGLDYLVQTGYDPRAMAESFNILLHHSWQSPAEVPTYLKSHPGLADRMTNVDYMIKHHPGYDKVKGRGDRKAFEGIKNRVTALTADALTARNYFDNLLKKDPNDAWAYHGKGMLFEKEQNFEKAIAEYEAALRIQPANAAFLTDLGGVLFKKKDLSGAMSALRRAVILNRESTRAHFLLARAYDEQGNMERAQELYERVLLMDPHHSETLYRLGYLLGRKGQLARAHLYSGLHFEEEEQTDKAKYHFEKARQSEGATSPEVREQIEAALKRIKEKEEEERGNRNIM
jgi:beta-barrel assembly-enhancing protease